MTTEQERYTAKEVSLIYGVPADTIRRWNQRGHLTSERLSPRKVFYRQRDIEQILAARRPDLLNHRNPTGAAI
jgi:DNA-binding transcriptional MerR regulator